MPDVWPEDMFELVFIPHRSEKLDDLAAMAEQED